ncbi:MAG: guanylate kinase [Phyllobacteriaceae bacterium]|nr:guanylate kinase [Phyllobacteriaceae bacterium]
MPQLIDKGQSRRGLMLVLSSPSGAGKSTIARNILDNDHQISLSISVTTRTRRPSEIDGIHYRFVTEREFLRLREADALAEWAEVHGNFYGTPRDAVEKALAEGRDMLFDIDWQGAAQLRAKMAGDLVEIFILPPSMRELHARLKRRAEDSDEIIGRRLANAREEISKWRDYEYIIVNSDLDESYNAVRSIVTAERLRRDRRLGLYEFVEDLLSEPIS